MTFEQHSVNEHFTNEHFFDVLIVGAGAAGLMAGIAAAQKGARVRLLDSQTKIGAKILVAGGGRCNVTNEFVDASRFHTNTSSPNSNVEDNANANGANASNAYANGVVKDASGKGERKRRAAGERSFVGRVLRAFSVEDTHRFFESLGVALKLEETGKYFPISNSSRTVLNALLEAVREAGAEIITGCEVTSVRPARRMSTHAGATSADNNANARNNDHTHGESASNCESSVNSGDPVLQDASGEHFGSVRFANTRTKVENADAENEAHDGWIVRTREGESRARTVILCTGGLALPKSGSRGAGYAFATRLGHTLVSTTPALTPLLSNVPAHAALSGTTLPVRLCLRDGEQLLAQYEGSFLWTHVGYSGPVALNISRHIAREKDRHPNARVSLRLLPDIKDGEEARFWHQFVQGHARKTLVNALSEMLPRRVAETVALQSAVAGQTPVGRLRAAQASDVRRMLLEMPLPVHAVADYVKAEATAGGIALHEIEPSSMMSRLHSGLFFAGEICDVDGWLGGYNFQWAWSSGTVAGRGAARHARGRETRAAPTSRDSSS
jgi:predicted Rossmann fold flavoprotein